MAVVKLQKPIDETMIFQSIEVPLETLDCFQISSIGLCN